MVAIGRALMAQPRLFCSTSRRSGCRRSSCRRCSARSRRAREAGRRCCSSSRTLPMRLRSPIGRISARGRPNCRRGTPGGQCFARPALRRACLGVATRSDEPLAAIPCSHPTTRANRVTPRTPAWRHRRQQPTRVDQPRAWRWRWRASSKTASRGAGSASTTCRCTTRTSSRTVPRWHGASPRSRDVPAVLFVTPEHNRSLPAVLKNAIDWGSKPTDKQVWRGRVAAITGTSFGVIGTAVGQQHLRQILGILEHDRDGRRGVHLVQAGSRRSRRQFSSTRASARVCQAVHGPASVALIGRFADPSVP